MSEDTEPQVIDQVIEEAAAEVPEVQEAEQTEQMEEASQEAVERQVPLSAVQKERKRRQDAEAASQRAQIELQYYKEQMSKKQSEPEEDETEYESATRAELKRSAQQIKEETMRDIEERLWVKANPEKKRMVDEDLAEFLQQRPNLAGAVASASNRYEEAFMLMQALTPKQQAALKPVAKQQAPGSPQGVPKAAGVNQATDVMQMSDEEYRAWRQTKRQRR